MSLELNNNGYDAKSRIRPKRNIKRTHKAEEILQAGESAPGLPSPGTPSTPTAVRSGSSPTPSDSWQPASMPRMTNRPANGRRPGRAGFSRYALPIFAPERFAIYSWPYPRPKNFLALSESQKAWKRDVDKHKSLQDIDDGCDDWYEFSGDRATYRLKTNRGDGLTMECCIASTFVNRAKRAFRGGKTWQDFEFEERTIDSEAHAREELDSRRRQVLESQALDNNLRLAVFDALKRRLREEIWLEPSSDALGSVRLPLPKNDSKMPTPDSTTAQVDQPIFPPIAAQADDGIRGWSYDKYGRLQPLHGDETALPNGMQNLALDMRAQARSDPRGAFAHSNRASGQRGRIGNVGVDGLAATTGTEEIGMKEPDFDTSDEDED